MKIRWGKLALTDERRLTAGGVTHDAPCRLPGGDLVHLVAGAHASGLVRTDGRGRFREPLVFGPGQYGPPRVSVDGSHVLFSHEAGPDGPWQIRAVNLDSLDGAVLVDSPKVRLADPVAHPDGERLLYVCEEREGGRDSHIWELVPASGERRPLTTSADRKDDQPALSPSGRFLAFRGRRGDEPDGALYLQDLESMETRPLTQAPGDSGQPVFLDEYRIVFRRGLPGGDGGLLLLDTLRCRERWLTGADAHAHRPAAHVDRKGRVRLYYSRRRDEAGDRDVHVATLAGARAESRP